jgi:hypothetical protein
VKEGAGLPVISFCAAMAGAMLKQARNNKNENVKIIFFIVRPLIRLKVIMLNWYLVIYIHNIVTK